MKKLFTIALLAISPFLINAQESDTPDALMLRNPDVSADEITFVFVSGFCPSVTLFLHTFLSNFQIKKFYLKDWIGTSDKCLYQCVW